ncbi:hypothetical protein GPECTOR_5g46 [Gonium pectorale]|uniref:Uncharacterized protein n=1 Tax=Gonium pectorale TaxID=33097 RepID=A0A150GWZ2_GONPE|nr:hypothetical protein GPECTOR_5g46 [Gonium pectorale]|eukprot:KXZ54381.1 hypothetical protein GPECTOR_5g46 [Gonium pectorale]
MALQDHGAGPGPSTSAAATASAAGVTAGADGAAGLAPMACSPPPPSSPSGSRTSYDEDEDATMRAAARDDVVGGEAAAAAHAPAGPAAAAGDTAAAAWPFAAAGVGVEDVDAAAAPAAAAAAEAAAEADADVPNLVDLPPYMAFDGDGAAAGGGGGGDGGGQAPAAVTPTQLLMTDAEAAAGAPDAAAAEAAEAEAELAAVTGGAAFWGSVATLPALQRLELQGGRLRPSDMAGLVSLTGLRELLVNNVINTHPGLSGLSALTGLTRLVIEELQYVGGAIHDEFCGLSRLTGLRSLSFLVVGPLPAEVVCWGQLTGLTQLEITNHFDEALLGCFTTVLPRLKSLRALNLSNFDITNAMLAALRPCRELSRLVMGRCCLTDPCADKMPEVRELHLGFVDDLQHTEVPLVCVFPRLDSLTLATRYVLSPDSAERIPRELLRRARELALPPPPQLQLPQQQLQEPVAADAGAGAGAAPQPGQQQQAQGQGQQPLQRPVVPPLGRSSTLPITRLQLYDALMSAALPAALPGLTSLRLDWSQTDVPSLLGYMGVWGPGLRSLAWSHCDALRDEALPQLCAALPLLTELELIRCVALSDAGLVALSGLTGLASLRIAGAPQLTAAGFAPLLAALPSLESLTVEEMAGLWPADADALECAGAAAVGRRTQLRVEVLP